MAAENFDKPDHPAIALGTGGVGKNKKLPLKLSKRKVFYFSYFTSLSIWEGIMYVDVSTGVTGRCSEC